MLCLMQPTPCCALCGAAEHRVPRLLVTPLAFACPDCVRKLSSEVARRHADLSAGSRHGQDACLLCGSTALPRVVLDGKAVCVDCADILDEIRVESRR